MHDCTGWLILQLCRGFACFEGARILLEIVTTSACSPPEVSIPQRSSTALSDWMTEHFTESAPGKQFNEGLTSAAQTSSTVTSFLLGAAAVPRDVLLRVSPVMLAKLFQHLGGGMLPTQPCYQVFLCAGFQI